MSAPAIKQSRFIWFRGECVPWESANVHVLTHALHYGSGVFEGIRCYDQATGGQAIFRLSRHLRRLCDSARVLRMTLPVSQDQLREGCRDVIRENDLGDAYIRIIAFCGYGSLAPVPGDSTPIEVAIAAFEWGALHGAARDEGADLCVSSWRRNAPGTTPGMAKLCGAYALSQLIAMEAKQNGFDDGLALSSRGHVAECSGANLFLVYRDELYTPPVADSVLPGITRDALISIAKTMGIAVREESIPREMLYAADEVFLTGTATEVCPVRSVDRISVGRGGERPITSALARAFFEIVRGERDEYRHWLTPV